MIELPDLPYTISPSTCISIHNQTSPVDVATISGSAVFSSSYTNASFRIASKAEFDDDIIIKGKSLVDTLAKIEERLGIIQRNPDLENKWDKLRVLGMQYRDMEKEIMEKEKMWGTLKK